MVCLGNYQVQMVGDRVDPLKSSLIIKAKKIGNSMGSLEAVEQKYFGEFCFVLFC